MTDQELNEQVARKLGWYALKWRDEVSRKPAWWGLSKDHTVESLVPDFCHSIEAAWEIFGYASSRYTDLTLVQDNDRWLAFFGIWDGQGINRNFSRADTAPRAICLAFLKLEDK